MNLLKAVLAFYLIIFLVLSNLLLLLCNDENYCFIPVGRYSLNGHLAFTLRQFYSQYFKDLAPLMVVANWVLYTEIIAFGIIIIMVIRKCFWPLIQIIGLTWTILYVVFQWSEYRAGHIIGRQNWVSTLSFFEGIGKSILLYFK